MNAAQLHPSSEQLLAFAHGRLSAPDFAEIESHISHCDSCCEWIASQPENTLVVLAREAATHGPGAHGVARPLPGEIPAALLEHARYRAIQQIGIGGMGAVYKAEHRMMRRTVAVKIIHPWLLSNAEAVERFHREMQVAARLTHPNIVVSYDADQAADLHFLAMEFVEGKSLDAVIARQGPASVEQACDWTRQAALGLQYAHEQGMVHRDIKPHNLMLTPEGQVKILDFGLSRVLADSTGDRATAAAADSLASRTHADAILGTPDYIAPEQIGDSRSASIRSDIYSLGCTLYFLLTGKPPFGQGSVVKRLQAHEQQPFPKLRDACPEVPARLEEILTRMTAKRPADRYAAPGEVASDLGALLSKLRGDVADVPPLPPPLPPEPGKSVQPFTRRNVILGGGLLALLLGITGASYFLPGAITADDGPTPMLVMLPSTGLWFPDYQGLVDAAARENVKLTFASVSENPSQTLFTSPPGVAMPDLKLDSRVTAEPYQAIVFIGYEASEFVPGGVAGEDTRRLLNEFRRQKKVIASLCAGQRILAQQGALQGKQVSACEYVPAHQITGERGTPVARPVITDGLVVTAGDAKDAPALLQAIKKTLGR